MLQPKRPELVTLTVSAFIVFVLNISFWNHLFAAIAPGKTTESLSIAAAGIVLLLVTNLALTLIANRRVFRVVMAAILPLTAAAGYFMHEYGVVIDENMVRNLFETNAAEARDLFGFKMVAAIALLGGLPAYLVWTTPWIERDWREQFRAGLRVTAISIPLIVALAFPFWGSYLSTFREHRELRMTLTPSNYISATVKYLRSGSALATTVVKPFGEDAERIASPGKRKSLFVIAVGETARADHFKLDGYPRQTNPQLGQIDDLINFPEAHSCGTDTARSVPCMFSGLGRENFSNARASSRENLLDILKHVGFDVIWRDNQAGCKGICQRVTTENLTALKHPAFYARSENFDEILLDGLEDRIARLERDTVIVMHMMGSHGPTYWKRYPDKYETFKPACKESQFSRCSVDEIVNAYDNTILYTDHVLAELVAILKTAGAHNVDAGMLYVSDHGESLGENNIYLHGMPYAFAPATQTHIPMFLWLSPQFRQATGVNHGCLIQNARSKTSHDALFHSVLGILDVVTDVYDRSLDLFAPCRPLVSTRR